MFILDCRKVSYQLFDKRHLKSAISQLNSHANRRQGNNLHPPAVYLILVSPRIADQGFLSFYISLRASTATITLLVKSAVRARYLSAQIDAEARISLDCRADLAFRLQLFFFSLRLPANHHHRSGVRPSADAPPITRAFLSYMLTGLITRVI